MRYKLWSPHAGSSPAHHLNKRSNVHAKRDSTKGNQNGIPRYSVKGCSPKFLRMAEIYEMFAQEWAHVLDFSDESLLELYNFESYGGDKPKQNNGFMHGKKMLNLNVEMWREDIEAGNLFKFELYEDEKFPHWWLDSVLSGMISGSVLR